MIWLLAYGLILFLFSVFSFSLTDPNLVLTSWPPYWQFQQWIWQTFFENRVLLTYTYLALVALSFTVYVGWLRYVKTRSIKLSLIAYLLILSPLLLSYNALSHDVFNYIFNAKIVRVYQANPHVQVALDFPQDDWLRFMHNTHTTAPYGYGWTALSLVPSALGLDKFVVTWEIFRIFSLLSLVLLWSGYGLYQRITGLRLSLWAKSVVLFNPLLVMEVISTQHNDLWMMVPALVSLIMLRAKKMSGWLVGLSALLLAFSISTKLATALLIPVWVGLVGLRLIKVNNVVWWTEMKKIGVTFWPLAASVLMFLPLLTLRSQQFHPWYLIWVLVWLPLFESLENAKPGVAKFLNVVQPMWRDAMLILSVSSMMRYLPWLWAGGFEGNVLWQQKLVTWVPLVVFVIGFTVWQAWRRPGTIS